MRLYINLEIEKDFTEKVRNEKIYLTIKSLDKLEDKIVNYFIKNYTWSTLVAYNIITRLDGPHTSINSYERKLMNIVGRKEKYSFNKGKSTLIWVRPAVIN